MKGKSDPKTLRSFGLLIGGVTVVIGLWPLVWRGEGIRVWALVVASAFFLTGLLRPDFLEWPHRGWMALAHALGWINTRILLGILFYGLLAPLGILKRTFAEDPLFRRFDPDAKTYRVARKPTQPTNMLRQF